MAQVRYWNSSALPLTGGHHPGWVSFTYWPSDMADVPGINLAPGYGILLAVVPWSSEEGAPQMPEWDFVAMGQVGLTGWARAAAHPVARWIARRTGRPEAENLSLIGAAFLATTLIGFLRNVDAVIAAGRTAPQPANDPPAGV